MYCYKWHGDDRRLAIREFELCGLHCIFFPMQRAVRRLKSESKDLEGDDTSSMLKLEGQELESEGKDPTAGQQSQIRKKITPEMDPEHSPDFDL